MKPNALHAPTKDRLLAAGGLIGALGASSCCVLPLGLALAGVGGAWIGTLTALAPYQPLFLAVALLCVGAGLWRSHRLRRSACAGPSCAGPGRRPLVRATLWVAAALVLVAGSVEWWASFLI